MSSSRLVSDEDLTLGETSLIKAELLAAVERLSPRLPPNTLDQLIDELGGPDYVAEVYFYFQKYLEFYCLVEVLYWMKKKFCLEII